MQKLSLRAHQTKRFKVTTNSSHKLPVAPNVLDRKFEAINPNKARLVDITYLWTQEGWLYLAVVLDLFLHKTVVGVLKAIWKQH